MPCGVFRDSSKQGADIVYIANNVSGKPNQSEISRHEV